MVVVLVQVMNARTPSAAARVIFVVDTLAFIKWIVADGINRGQPCSDHRIATTAPRRHELKNKNRL
jgi:hypothetical protein